MQKSQTVGFAITRHTCALSGGDLICLGSGYRAMSRSAWTAAVNHRFQRHARPIGTTSATQCKLPPPCTKDSAFQNQARKQRNQAKIKPFPTKKFHYLSPRCDIRSYTLRGSNPSRLFKPITVYSSIFDSPRGYMVAVRKDPFFHSRSFKAIQGHSKAFKAIQRFFDASFFIFMRHLQNGGRHAVACQPLQGIANHCQPSPPP
jgi:hypothetical protein